MWSDEIVQLLGIISSGRVWRRRNAECNPKNTTLSVKHYDLGLFALLSLEDFTATYCRMDRGENLLGSARILKMDRRLPA